MTRDDRPLLERLLDGPQRLAENAPLPEDARLVLAGLVRFVKQVIRSKRR